MKKAALITLIALGVAINAYMAFKYGIWTRWDAWQWLISR
jgi:hypothetical protein